MNVGDYFWIYEPVRHEPVHAAFFSNWDGISKVSFKFLQTLFRTCIYILVYEIKIVTNILMGFKLWCEVGGGKTQFSKLPYLRGFLNRYMVPNCHFRFRWWHFVLKSHPVIRFFENSETFFALRNWKHTISYAGHVHGVIYGWMDDFDFASTLSLRGPGLSNLQTRPKAEFTYGMDGMGYQKCPSIFFILCRYIDYVYISTYIRNKNCHQHSYRFENLLSSWS